MALFGKKKENPADDVFQPEQLEKLENKGDRVVEVQRNFSIFDRFTAKRDAKKLRHEAVWKRRTATAIIVLIAVLGIVWLISMLLTVIGDLTIDVKDTAAKKGIVISAHADGSDPQTRMHAENVKEVTNITKDWLPKDLDTEKDGAHNGKNYMAYTFYLANNGKETLDYVSTLKMTGVAKSADEAIRIMIYKNGTPVVYGKVNMDGSDPVIADKKFKYKQRFKDVPINESSGKQEEIIFENEEKGLKPNQKDKYTIVTWIEGEDVECIDDIMGGYCKMQWFFSVKDEDL